MRRRLVLVTFLFAPFIIHLSIHSSFAQALEDTPPPVVESPPPSSEAQPASIPTDEHRLPELLPHEQEDAVTALGALRNAVRLSPDSADSRLKLAEGLYRIGDLDAAIEECRVALTLESHNADAYLQLGVSLMVKQDARAAATALKEAILLDPTLTHAHYSLGSAQYSLGHLTAAIQSYRRALDLQPNFPDARYRLALVLKLTNQHREAVQLMEEAAIGGVPQAQYFMGNAYRNGQGVEKNLSLAIRWWTKAIEFGQPRAGESLSQLRRQALSPDQPERRRKDMIEAFRQYRDDLWADHPDVARDDQSESLGITLLNNSQSLNGITVLFTEAFALSETAHDELARLYETGLDTRLAQFDTRTLTCFTTTAADGFIPAKKALARIYGKGLGVTPDLQKAKAMLKGLPKQETKAILDEIVGR
ncbi:MAG: tetratricopeptide repeat protein [Nitrospiraceae bacterium]|nr:MAG: tetratricopeptide repeat protein [Nitrospiraceae bacterium]